MIDPTEAVSLGYLQASAAIERGEVERARRELELLVMEYPGFAPAWDGLGRCWDADGDLEEAGACFQRAIRLDRKNWRSRYHWGTALQRAGEYRPALKWLREATKLAPRERVLHYQLGSCLTEQGLHAEALRALRTALELPEREVTDPEVLLRIAEAEMELGDLDSADAACSRAALIAPTDPAVYYQWSLLSLRQGQPADAERLAARAQALAPRSLRYALHLIQLAVERGDLSAAEQRISSLPPEHGRLGLGLRSELALRRGNGVQARLLAMETLGSEGPAEDQAVDRALLVLRKLNGVTAPCEGYRLVLRVDYGEECYFRPYVVLARDLGEALEMVAALQDALDPAPWELHEEERFEHPGEALLGVCQIMLTRVLFPKDEPF